MELEKQYSHIHVRQKLYNPFYFDDARNDALNFVKEYVKEGDWLFTLDLDEYASKDFVKIIRPQLERAKNCNAICLKDHSGCWHWQGHKYSKNYKWFYHIHESILTLDGKPLEENVYLQNVSYFHNQDESKPRKYRQMLRDMLALEPNNLHYLAMAFEEENIKNNDDPEYREWVRDQMIENVMHNKNDVHYHDYAFLTYAAIGATRNIVDLVNYFYEAERDIDEDIYTDFRCFHLTFAYLLKQMLDTPDCRKKIEEEYLRALMLKSDLGWWVDVNCTDGQIWLEFLLWLFYNKKDSISATHYAQQLYLHQPNKFNGDNIDACAQANKPYQVLVFKDLTTTLEEVTLLRNLNDKEIAVVVSMKLDAATIQTLLNMQVHILYV